MIKYGKIVCGALQVPQNYPCSIELEGQTIHNPTDEQYIAAGYLPIEESESEERPGKVAVASYAVSKDKAKIVQSWQYVDEPEERIEDGMPEEGQPSEEENV